MKLWNIPKQFFLIIFMNGNIWFYLTCYSLLSIVPPLSKLHFIVKKKIPKIEELKGQIFHKKCVHFILWILPDLSIVTIQCQNDATLICSLSLKIAFVHILMDEHKREKKIVHFLWSYKVKLKTKETFRNKITAKAFIKSLANMINFIEYIFDDIVSIIERVCE